MNLNWTWDELEEQSWRFEHVRWISIKFIETPFNYWDLSFRPRDSRSPLEIAGSLQTQDWQLYLAILVIVSFGSFEYALLFYNTVSALDYVLPKRVSDDYISHFQFFGSFECQKGYHYDFSLRYLTTKSVLMITFVNFNIWLFDCQRGIRNYIIHFQYAIWPPRRSSRLHCSLSIIFHCQYWFISLAKRYSRYELSLSLLEPWTPKMVLGIASLAFIWVPKCYDDVLSLESLATKKVLTITFVNFNIGLLHCQSDIHDHISRFQYTIIWLPKRYSPYEFSLSVMEPSTTTKKVLTITFFNFNIGLFDCQSDIHDHIARSQHTIIWLPKRYLPYEFSLSMMEPSTTKKVVTIINFIFDHLSAKKAITMILACNIGLPKRFSRLNYSGKLIVTQWSSMKANEA